jgi:hypothetical protein
MMKYAAILCLSLGLTGCFGWGPYASATGPGYGPVPDLGACARSPEPRTRIDQICNRQDGNPYGIKLIPSFTSREARGGADGVSLPRLRADLGSVNSRGFPCRTPLS